MKPPSASPRARALALLCACAIIFSPAAARAQEAQAPRAEGGKFALEIFFVEGQPTYWRVPGGGWSGRFGRVANGGSRAGSSNVQAVNVAAREEGDGVRVNVSVHVGEGNHFDRQLDVATFLAREGETVVVGELKEFGVAPARVKVLRLSPAPVAPPSVESQAPSVVVLGVERAGGGFPAYSIRVRNLSGKDISSLKVIAYMGDDRPAEFVPHAERDEPLVRAGEAYEFTARGGEHGVAADGTYTPAGLSRVVVTAAVFAEGSYEGDPKEGARARASWLGRRTQLARIVALLREASAAPDAETDGALARLRAQVSALDESCDAARLDALLAEFPPLGAKDRAYLKVAAELELHQRKNELLLTLEKIGGASRGGAPPPGYRDRLAHTAEIYSDWLARLPSD